MVWTYSGVKPLHSSPANMGTLTQAIKSAFQADLGLSPFDEFQSGGFDNFIYRINTASALYPFAYYRIQASSNTVLQTGLGTGWDTNAKTGTNFANLSGAPYQSSTSLTFGSLYNYIALTGPEGKLKIFWRASEPTRLGYLGWLRPQTLPPGWNEDNCPAVWHPIICWTTFQNNIFTNMPRCSLINYGGQSLGSSMMLPAYRPNPDGSRAIISPQYFTILSGANAVLGPGFSDLASGACTDRYFLETITIGTDTWLIIEPGIAGISPSILARIG